jgi:hypothetical protein
VAGRYRARQSLTALAERSRQPHESPRRIATSLEEQILQLRSPDGWGARKIAQLLWEAGVRVSYHFSHTTGRMSQGVAFA